MMGYTQLAMRHIPEENKVAREKIAQIDKAGVRARDLVAQILAFSRQNEQKSDVCYLREMVRDMVGFLGASLPSNIEIRFETGPGALKVIADPVQVHQIVINLATNAFHAIGEGGGTIEICVEEVVVHEAEALAFHLPEGPYVCISVRDDGHGVDPEIASRIFEPYYTTKEIGKGTGMGLAVVHGIVLNHGGTVQFESQRGRGSLFRVYLPAGDASERNSQSSEKDVDSRGAKDVILIVDGEEIFIDLAREVLGRIGYQVEAYTDATKAMEVFSEYPEKYVAVVAELFPGGEMVLKTVKGRMDDLPVVITSGLCRTEMKKELQGVGVEGMLTKPFTLKELAEELRVSIAKKKN